MLKTYQNLIHEARELLQDTDVSLTRFSDATLLNILNRGMHDMARIRPDFAYTLYNNNIVEIPEIVSTTPASGQINWTTPYAFEGWTYNNLLSYIVGVAEITDDEYTEDGRAGLLIKLFKLGSVAI